MIKRFIELPDSVKAGVTAVVVFAFGWVFAQIVLLVPFLAWLAPYIPGLAAGAAAALIALLQNRIPDEYGEIAIQVIKLVLMVLAVLGIGNGVAIHKGLAFFALF
jgi:hypothetical protein